MTHDPNHPARGATPAADRRTGHDRRKRDELPDGWRDRRRHVEARKPEVVELDMTASQWAAFEQGPPPDTAPKT